MTQDKSFKRRVRERMAKTGERYTAARRQLLAATEGATAGPAPTSGIHPATTALRLLLHHAGREARETTLLAAGGGVGMGVFAFRYDDFSSLFLAGRHLWHDDLQFLAGAAERLGCTLEVRETGGRKKAERDLLEMLEHGPVVAFVDLGTLGHRGPVEAYYVVVVLGADPERGTARIADLADTPVEVPLAALADARARHRKFANRLLRLTDAPDPLPWRAAVRAGLRACIRGLRESPMRGYGSNFTLDALDVLARRMRGGGKDGWDETFPPGPRRWAALEALYEYVEHYGTGGGLLRPFFADALTDARTRAGIDVTRPVEAYAELGEAWTALAAAALPASVPAFDAMRRLVDDTYATYYANDAEAPRLLADLRRQRAELTAGDFPLTPAEAEAHAADLAGRVDDLAGRERAALEALEAVLGPPGDGQA